jgi:two-component system nitrate/nitrite sensor histidine kinase NarX
MITILPIIYGLAAGLSLYAALNHLLVGLRQRPRNQTHLAFSLMTFLVAGMIIADAGYRMSTTLERAALTLDIGISLTALALAVFLWFVANYTGFRPRRFLVIVSLILVLLSALNLLLPNGILYAELTGLNSKTMPWGEPFALIEGVPSNLQLVNILLFILTFTYCFIAITCQYRNEEKREALFLLLGISPIILGTVFDFLLDFGIITNFIGLYPISYVGLVMIMSFALSDEMVKRAVTLRTQATVLENMQEGVNVSTLQGEILFTNNAFDTMFGYDTDDLIGRHISTLNALDEADNQDLVQDIIQELKHNQVWSGEFHNVRKDGSKFDTSAVISELEIGEESFWVSVQADITERKRSEAELAQYRGQLENLVEKRTAELSQAVGELNTLNEVAQTVATFMDLRTTTQQVCETVAPLFAAAVVVVNVVDIENESIELLAGFDRDRVDGFAPGVGQILPLSTTRMVQQVFEGNEPLKATGLQSKPDELSPILKERRIDALLIVPLRSRGETIGVLGILRDKTETIFTDADVVLAEAIAGYVAGAIENAQLTQQLAETAVAEERSRIARELHDAVTQNLFTVATIADALPDLWDSHPKETRQALENLRRLSRGALAEMRVLLLELHPTALLEKPLGKLLQQLGEGLEGRSLIQVTTSIVADRILDAEVQIAFYRIAQEALNNVIKHSEATQVTIGLYGEKEALTLSIKDNGVGFAVDGGEIGGFGLGNMEIRAHQIDATLEIDSELGNGTEVSLGWRPTVEVIA